MRAGGDVLFRAADGSDRRRRRWPAKSPVNFDDAEVVREFATSKDGTRVPVNIIRRKGTELDGTNPYAGDRLRRLRREHRAAISSRSNRVLLDHGFVVAVANMRGGGEYGEAWHLAGNLTKKQNVFDDFAAVLRHLIEREVHVAEQLAIIGGSNGGLLMGAMLTQHPDADEGGRVARRHLRHAAVELSPNGEFNITEFGTVKNAGPVPGAVRVFAVPPREGRRELSGRADADRGERPAGGADAVAEDDRAAAGGRRRATRRSCCGRATDTGHGCDTPLAEQIAQTVDVYAFLFDSWGWSSRRVARPPSEA